MSDVLTILIMALALSVDAFSLSLGFGMSGMRGGRIMLTSFTVGVFHMIMPFAGIIAGHLLSHYTGALAYFIGGSGLMVLGLQTLTGAYRRDPAPVFSPHGAGLILFAVSVSADSLAAGISLAIIGTRTWITIFAFGITSAIFTFAGLLAGKKAGTVLGAGESG